jgi:hypothetical protein
MKFLPAATSFLNHTPTAEQQTNWSRIVSIAELATPSQKEVELQ